MPQQQTEPLVVPVDRWYNESVKDTVKQDIMSFTQTEWMLYRKDHKIHFIQGLTPQAQLILLEPHYVINDLDIRKIQEQEAAGNYFLMSLYINTMVFDKAAL